MARISKKKESQRLEALLNRTNSNNKTPKPSKTKSKKKISKEQKKKQLQNLHENKEVFANKNQTETIEATMQKAYSVLESIKQHGMGTVTSSNRNNMLSIKGKVGGEAISIESNYKKSPRGNKYKPVNLLIKLNDKSWVGIDEKMLSLIDGNLLKLLRKHSQDRLPQSVQAWKQSLYGNMNKQKVA